MDINNEIEDVLANYPLLEYNVETQELIGELLITDSDSYEIKMDLTPYPELFPHVYELGDRIPKKAIRHIYTDSNSCCFTTAANSQILLNTKITSLTLFISEIVIPYFQNNSYFELNDKYNTEEYSHDRVNGVVEGYRDILCINNDMKIAIILEGYIKGKKIKENQRCYCGSGRSLKKCHSGKHQKCYWNLKYIHIGVLKLDLKNSFIPILNQKRKV